MKRIPVSNKIAATGVTRNPKTATSLEKSNWDSLAWPTGDISTLP